MKKLFIFLVFIFSFVAVKAQPTSIAGHTTINSGYNWLRGVFRGLHVPAGTAYGLATNQYGGAGALYVDTVGADSGFYYRGQLGYWHKLAKYSDLGVFLTWGDTTTLATQWYVDSSIAAIDLSDYITWPDTSTIATQWWVEQQIAGVNPGIDNVLAVNQSLTANRTINVSDKILYISGSNGGHEVLNVGAVDNNLPHLGSAMYVATSGTNSGDNYNTFALTGENTRTGGMFSINYGLRGIADGGTTNFGVFGTSNGSGSGVFGLSAAGIGVSGTSSSNYGGSFNSNSGIGLAGSSTSSVGVFAASVNSGLPLRSRIFTSATNTVAKAAEFVTESQGTVTDGLGVSIDLVVESSTGTNVSANSIESVLVNATHANRTSNLNIKGLDNAATETFMNIQPDGTVRVNNNTDTLATKAYARSVGGGGGETNTASNVGGGLANFNAKDGVDLEFNTFNADHFDLASNLISLDATLKSNYDAAHTDRLKWDGGATGLTASTGRTSLGATTVGSNIFTLTNPSATGYIRTNADNTVTHRSYSEVKTDLSLDNVTNESKATMFTNATFTGTFNVADGAIANADLANSTISGVALGGNLNNLTATDATLTFSGSYNGSTARTVGLNLNNANTWGDGFKQTFNPDATNAGLNVGAHTADPSSPANGDIFYNSTSNELRARINGSWVALGAGGGGGNIMTSGTATGAVSGNLDGNSLTITNTSTKLQIDNTLGETLLQQYNSTGSGNTSLLDVQAKSDETYWRLRNEFNGGVNQATISGFADAGQGSVNISASTRVIVGGGAEFRVEDLGGNGTGIIEVDNDGDASFGYKHWSEDAATKAVESLGGGLKYSVVYGINQGIASTTSVNLVDARAVYMAVWIDKPTTITGVIFSQSSQGNYTADNNNKIGLYTYSGGTLTKVAESANDGNLWKNSSGGWNKKAFTSTYDAQPGLHFIAAIYNNSAQTTGPAVYATVANVPSIFLSQDFTNSAKIIGTRNSQTDLPSSESMSNLSTTATNYWFGLY